MTYEVIILGHLHMPLYFIGTFTEYPYLVSRPFGGLSLRLQYSYNYKQSKGRDFYPSMTLYGSGGYKGQKGQLTNTERLSENQDRKSVV